MAAVRRSGCSEVLLDLLWYEVRCRRLSPEMELILTWHLGECPECKERFEHFTRVLKRAMIS